MMTIMFEQFQKWIPNEEGRRSTEVRDNLRRRRVVVTVQGQRSGHFRVTT